MKKLFIRFRSIGSRDPQRPAPAGVWRRRRVVAVGLLVLGLGLAAGGLWWRGPGEEIPEVPISTVARELEAGRVRSMLLDRGGSRVTATLAAPVAVDGSPTARVTAVLPGGALELRDLQAWSSAGVEVRVAPSSERSRSAIGFVVALLLAGGLLYALVRAQRNSMSRRFRVTPEERRLTLSDVGGAREAQADLRDVIAFLRDPSRFEAMGAKCPKGILLVGPPGTGKTLLARAVAGESGRPVIVASGSEFTEMFVGVGARRVRDLAQQARASAPCIVFIDEFDSIGGRRGRPNRSGEEETTLNQLLVEMDGLSGAEGVVWMAATNREDMLDPAVRRPGRFDRVVEVGMPTTADRLEILRIHASRRPLAGDVDLERLAALTAGHSGADLENLLNEAAILAVQDESRIITREHLEQARDKIQLGRLRAGVVVGEEERRLVAVHEAGHVVTGLIACPEDQLHKVTIEARGRSLGAAHFAPDAERHLYSRRYLEGNLVKALGGRAAELVFFGPDGITSGAGSDLVQATRIARQMVAEFGMSDEVGLVSASPAAHGSGPSGRLQGEIDSAVRGLIARQMSRAEELIRTYRAAVEAIAGALLEHNVLPAERALALAREHGVPVRALSSTSPGS